MMKIQNTQIEPLPGHERAPSRASKALISSNQPEPRAHVLFLVDAILASGGGEGALLKIVRHLPRDRFRCSLAVFKAGGQTYSQFREASCPVYEFPINKILSLQAFKASWQLREFMRRHRVDIVHTFFETANLWGALITKLGSNRPLLVSSRRDMGILRSAKHRIAYRLLHPLFDSVVAVSAPVREACIRDEGIAPELVVTLHNGVELHGINVAREATTDMRTQLRVSGASHVITSVGHIRRFKGFDVMIKAAAKVCREFPKAVFVIAGDFYETDHVVELRQMTHALGISDNIRFAGAVSDVTSLLSISDVFCLLSRTEGFSNALLEAMASALPTVATRVGGAEEAIADGQNGFLVNSEDADAAAERILVLLKDGELARRMGGQARETVQTKFTAEIMCKALAEHYDQLLRKGHSSLNPQANSENVLIKQSS